MFIDEAGNPTASVLIESRGLTEIGGDQVDAIVHLVASSVKNMQPADVTVIGAAGQVLSSGGSGLTSGGSARTSAETSFEHELAASLTAMVARVTGPGHVAVTVSADLDLVTATVDVRDLRARRRHRRHRAGRAPDGPRPRPTPTPPRSRPTPGVLGPDGVVVTPDAASDRDGRRQRLREGRHRAARSRSTRSSSRSSRRPERSSA